jgi:glycosyltransferase involved in cell wall biosynthesis
MKRNARSVRRFIAPSEFYARHMRQQLDATEGQIKVLFNGIDASSFTTASPDPNWPTIGYFARMIHGKGLTTLIDAYIALVKRGSVPRLKLLIGGAATPVDEKYIAEQKAKLKAAGCDARVEWRPNLDFKDKVHFFRDLTVFSVPATYGEAFGLYVIEAIASGVPVVEPRHGAFPELIEATGGGILCEPDNVESLATALESLLLDGERCDQLIKTGVANVRARFSATKMAEDFESMLREAIA